MSAYAFAKYKRFIPSILLAFLSFVYKNAPASPARPITTRPAPTINSFFAPLFAVLLVDADAELPLSVVLLATLTAPLDPVAAPVPVAAVFVVVEGADTAREMALLVVEGYCEASAQYADLED